VGTTFSDNPACRGALLPARKIDLSYKLLSGSLPRTQFINMRMLCAVILLPCLAVPSFGQAACNQEIVVNARNSKGEFVSDLDASSFQVKVGGHEASVTSAGIFAGTNRVILVLDASGSMGSGDKDMRRWNAVKNFAEQIVEFAPPSSRLALVIFNREIIVKLGFEYSRNDLIAAIDRVPEAKEQTALWKSVVGASEVFGNVSQGDSMVVISDFGDNTHKTDAAEVQKTLTAKGFRMFGIGIFGYYFSSQEERDGPDILFALAKETGGDTITFPLSNGTGGEVRREIGLLHENVPGLLTWLFDRIGKFYDLKITPSAPLSRRERLNLSLAAENGKKNKRIVLYYPRYLNPCTP
jgi:hypothetical protein